MSTRERRFISGAGLRAAEGATPGIQGVAAVYSQQYDTGWYVESIMPGAFTRALVEQQDVRCLFNHDVNQILARTKNGTLRLADSTAGLKFEADTDPATSVGRDVPAMISRGDIDGCSFSFNVRMASWRDEYDANGNYVQSYREIEDVDLFDVGPVTFPAYTATSVDLKAARAAVGELEQAHGLWPEGLPADVRRYVERRQAGQGSQAPGRRRRPVRASGEPGYCTCDCAESMAGDCENCSHVDCDCMDCLCDAAQGLARDQLRARAHMGAV
jgi:HK97 family phage prohead protease